ncbi:MAG TPA: hypothetical protein VH351_06735 [Bryobacteraceae bacterium]|jgi:hypothetical protein|nr:hypothetical protein [Bryobacteraceae bacterium]
MEVHAGDLKARASFIRAGLQTLEAAADWSGYPRRIVSDQPGAAIQIVIPVPTGERNDFPDADAVEIGLPRR